MFFFRKENNGWKSEIRLKCCLCAPLFEWLLYFIIALLPYLVNVYNFDLQCFYENYDASFFRAFPSSVTLLPAHIHTKNTKFSDYACFANNFLGMSMRMNVVFSHLQHVIIIVVVAVCTPFSKAKKFGTSNSVIQKLCNKLISLSMWNFAPKYSHFANANSEMLLP